MNLNQRIEKPMPEPCFACEYKRLARQSIEDFVTLVGLLDLLGKQVGVGWKGRAANYKQQFLSLHQRQRQETEDANVEAPAIASPRF
jgi:hypothetical protein